MTHTTEIWVKILGKQTEIGAANVLMNAVAPAVSDVVTHLVKHGADRKVVISAAENTAEAIVKGMTFMVHGPE
ncbi:hypothetical protein [Photorhabdus heterorhabditis]|uniref:hypothetical protein n=1 Tax=Photorhabdus heterorhabditis TaxID=880156 RepID=UPI0015625B49|nr:hypothetical protein [Photorhabdus heterorhabditis]NRN27886.1 hypothetical protein [Photorhabdus heterorhabditis subsp. aluminescens]